LQEFAEVVGSDRVNVQLLLPPGREPHSWEPRPTDIVNLSKADIFIYIGAGLEPWAKDLLEGVKSSSLLVIEASEGLDLIYLEELNTHLLVKETKQKNTSHRKYEHRHHHERIDPHVWLDFRNDQKIIDKIVKVFSRMDPEGTAIYINNGKKYKEKLAGLDIKYAQGLKNCKRSIILLGGHGAFSYVARKYELKEIPLHGMSPDAEPKPRELAEVIDFAEIQGIKAVFFERLVNDRLARVVAEEIGAVTLVLNSGPNLTKKEIEEGITFISLMEENLRNLMKGLECE
jgi:zinc transport system substrate-binding protein